MSYEAEFYESEGRGWSSIGFPENPLAPATTRVLSFTEPIRCGNQHESGGLFAEAVIE